MDDYGFVDRNHKLVSREIRESAEYLGVQRVPYVILENEFTVLFPKNAHGENDMATKDYDPRIVATWGIEKAQHKMKDVYFDLEAIKLTKEEQDQFRVVTTEMGKLMEMLRTNVPKKA